MCSPIMLKQVRFYFYCTFRGSILMVVLHEMTHKTSRWRLITQDSVINNLIIF